MIYKKYRVKLTGGNGSYIGRYCKKKKKIQEQKNIPPIGKLKEIISNEEIRNRIIQNYNNFYFNYKEYNISDVEKALKKINFNRGKLCTSNHLFNKKISLIFLKDKNVILFNSFFSEYFVYCCPDGIDTKLEIKSKKNSPE